MSFGHLIDLILLGALSVAVFPYFSFVLLTSLAAIFGSRRSPVRRTANGTGGRGSPRFLVVIPAHNEEGGIAGSVESALSVGYPTDRFEVLVIADNCTDGTVEKAREAGARILERFDLVRRSKGYAIEFLIDTLRESGEFDSLDALVILDADSTVHHDLLSVFARCIESGEDWVQCYDCVGNADQSWRTRLMAYAFSLINGVTLLGQNALGLSAALRGNGMCLTTRGLRRVPWKTRGLTEDLEYSWTVRIAGGRIAFEREVMVYATMLSRGGKASETQRNRWESGRRALRRRMIGPLLRSTQLGWLEKMAAFIELTMPSGTSMFWLYLLLASLACVRGPYILERHEFGLLITIVISLVIATFSFVALLSSPFFLSFLPWRFGLSLAYAPYYAIWKTVVAFKGRPQTWVPTVRENTTPELASRQ